MHNFEVENDHNYYVTDAQLLVHNCEVSDQAWAINNNEKVLGHVIDPPKHGFGDIIAKSGGREQALKRIVDSLFGVGDLPPAGVYEVTRTIEGEVVTIRGAVVNGIPRISTAFIRAKFPGGGG